MDAGNWTSIDSKLVMRGSVPYRNLSIGGMDPRVREDDVVEDAWLRSISESEHRGYGSRVGIFMGGEFGTAC